MAGERPVTTGYESADVKAGTILAVALALLLVLTAVLALLSPWRRQATVEPPSVASGPALLADPVARLAQERAVKTERLNGYGWVDREGGIAHIPVGRAIDLLVTQGGQRGERP